MPMEMEIMLFSTIENYAATPMESGIMPEIMLASGGRPKIHVAFHSNITIALIGANGSDAREFRIQA